MTTQFNTAKEILRIGEIKMKRGRKPAAEKKVNLQVGDVVRLKSGSPHMTVRSLEGEHDLHCVYFQYGESHRFDSMFFDKRCVQKVEEETLSFPSSGFSKELVNTRTRRI